MQNSIRIIAFAIAFVCDAQFVHAQPDKQKTGGVLLLKSLRAFEGEIKKKDDHYLIKRGAGELTLPAEQALLLFDDWEQAFAFVASRANLRDPDERIRLAKWCQSNRLFKQALHEIAAALEMRPSDVKAQHLRDVLKRQIQNHIEPPVDEPKTNKLPMKTVKMIDVDTSTLALFTTRVQPILMNACIRCHSHGKGGDFQLLRTHLGSRRTLTQRNLATVMQFIDKTDPTRSLFLSKAIHAHGGAIRPPLQGESSVPYQWMHKWAAMLLRNNPHLAKKKEKRTDVKTVKKNTAKPTQKSATARALPHQTFAQKPVIARTIEYKPGLKSDAPIDARPVPHVANRTTKSNKAARAIANAAPNANVQTAAQQPTSASSADPYDPAAFNALIHPNGARDK